MKMIEHIKPKGECTLKVKVWLLDKRIEFQVLGQKSREQPDPLFIGDLVVHSWFEPELADNQIFLRGEHFLFDEQVVGISFKSNTDRDAYYAKMKVALAAAAEAMK